MCKQLFLIYFILTTCLLLCDGQVLQFGTCAEVKSMKYFDLEKFQGQWIEIERFPIWYEHLGNCAFKRIQYCFRRVEIEHVFVKDGIQYVLHLNTTYAPGDDAIFYVQENNIDPIGIPMMVISTDYSNYAVVYGCKNNDMLGLKYISAWILSRTSNLSEDLLLKARHELNSIPSANVAYLEKVEHSEYRCKYHWTAHVHAVNLYDKGDK